MDYNLLRSHVNVIVFLNLISSLQTTSLQVSCSFQHTHKYTSMPFHLNSYNHLNSKYNLKISENSNLELSLSH